MLSLSVCLRQVFGIVAAVTTLAFATPATSQSVIYTSTDQEFAEVILAEAESSAQLRIVAVFDAEAAKTVGLERRLVAEKAKPKADIFWNSEFLRSHRLHKQGVLAPIPAGNKAPGIPATFISDYSVGFGIRSRVIAVNTRDVPPSDPCHYTQLELSFTSL